MRTKTKTFPTGKTIIIKEVGSSSGYRERVALGATLAQRHTIFANGETVRACYDPHCDQWLGTFGNVKVGQGVTASLDIIGNNNFKYEESES